jgi:hypothetical protein
MSEMDVVLRGEKELAFEAVDNLTRPNRYVRSRRDKTKEDSQRN